MLYSLPTHPILTCITYGTAHVTTLHFVTLILVIYLILFTSQPHASLLGSIRIVFVKRLYMSLAIRLVCRETEPICSASKIRMRSRRQDITRLAHKITDLEAARRKHVAGC